MELKLLIKLFACLPVPIYPKLIRSLGARNPLPITNRGIMVNPIAALMDVFTNERRLTVLFLIVIWQVLD